MSQRPVKSNPGKVQFMNDFNDEKEKKCTQREKKLHRIQVSCNSKNLKNIRHGWVEYERDQICKILIFLSYFVEGSKSIRKKKDGSYNK